MVGKLLKLGDTWAIESELESGYTIIPLSPYINNDSCKDILLVEIFNVPVINLQYKEVEFTECNGYAILKDYSFDKQFSFIEGRINSPESIARNEFKNVGDEGLFPNHSDKDIWI